LSNPRPRSLQHRRRLRNAWNGGERNAWSGRERCRRRRRRDGWSCRDGISANHRQHHRPHHHRLHERQRHDFDQHLPAHNRHRHANRDRSLRHAEHRHDHGSSDLLRLEHDRGRGGLLLSDRPTDDRRKHHYVDRHHCRRRPNATSGGGLQPRPRPRCLKRRPRRTDSGLVFRARIGLHRHPTDHSHLQLERLGHPHDRQPKHRRVHGDRSHQL
jgi:hypothetical protein